MMTAYALTAGILLYLTINVNAGVERCPSHLHRTRNLIQELSSCYEYHIDEEKKWEDARDNCKANQGHLVVINSASEQAKVFNGLQKLGYHKDIWIGFTDKPEENTWKWVTGDTVRYTNWEPNQPGMMSSFEDCAVMKFSESGHWHDYPCSDILFARYRYGWVCEYDLV